MKAVITAVSEALHVMSQKLRERKSGTTVLKTCGNYKALGFQHQYKDKKVPMEPTNSAMV